MVCKYLAEFEKCQIIEYKHCGQIKTKNQLKQKNRIKN